MGKELQFKLVIWVLE